MFFEDGRRGRGQGTQGARRSWERLWGESVSQPFPGPAASASPGNVIETYRLEPHLRPADPETLGRWGLAICVRRNPQEDGATVLV